MRQKFAEKIQSYVGDLKEVSGVQVDNTDKKTLLKNLSNPADLLLKHKESIRIFYSPDTKFNSPLMK